MSGDQRKSIFGFLSKSHAEVRASSFDAPGSYSVNSLSRMGGHLSHFSSGDTVKTVSFWLCFLICASLIADLTSLLIEKYLPTPMVSPLASRTKSGGGTITSLANYEIINERNLFSSKTTKKGETNDYEAEPVPTNLNYQLVGTVIFHNPMRSLAAIQDKNDNKLYPVRVNDMIGDNVEITSIQARKVIFTNSVTKRREYVEIPEDPAIKISTASSNGSRTPTQGINQLDENRFVISKAEIEAQTSPANFNLLMTQARALPELRGGQMVGFRITQIVPGSFYQKIGIKDNDVLKAVNGDKMTDASKGLELYQALKTMPSVDITVERGGRDVNLNYDFR